MDASRCVPLEGVDALRATLEAKLSVARLRAQPANPDRTMREQQAAAAVRYRSQLDALEAGRA